MKSISDILANYNNQTSKEDIESIKSNPLLCDFIKSNNISNEEIEKSYLVLSSYITDVYKEGNKVFSKKYPTFIPVLSYNFGTISVNYIPSEKTVRVDYLGVDPKEIDSNLLDFSIKKVDRKNAFIYARIFAESFKEGKEIKGMYISGKFGSGKTYLSNAIAKEVAKQGKSVCFVSFPYFVKELKGLLGNFQSQESLTSRISKPDLLILDDFRGDYLMPYIRDEILLSILDYRISKHLPILITSDIAREHLKGFLAKDNTDTEMVKSDRIVDRICAITDEYKLNEKYEEVK